MNQDLEFVFGFACVALLYFLFSIGLSVEVSDTTKPVREQKLITKIRRQQIRDHK